MADVTMEFKCSYPHYSAIRYVLDMETNNDTNKGHHTFVKLFGDKLNQLSIEPHQYQWEMYLEEHQYDLMHSMVFKLHFNDTRIATLFKLSWDNEQSLAKLTEVKQHES